MMDLLLFHACKIALIFLSNKRRDKEQRIIYLKIGQKQRLKYTQIYQEYRSSCLIFLIQLNNTQMNNINLNASFSKIMDTEQDDSSSFFSPHILHQFNREYSLIFKEVQKFLQQCKNSIQRFVTLHSFGVNFNLTRMLGTLSHVESTLHQSLQQNKEEVSNNPKMTAKLNYQLTFNKLVIRMGGFLTEIFECQKEFKEEYFMGKPHKEKPAQQKKAIPRILRSNSILTSSRVSNHSVKHIWEEEEKDQARQAELRQTLNQRLQLKLNKVEDNCRRQFSTTQNLYRLNERIEDVISHMKGNRERESKLIELFNLKRIKRLPLSQSQQTPTPSTNISVNSDHDHDENEIDQFLDNCRSIHKDCESYTQRGGNGQERNFKKVNIIPNIDP